MLEKVASNMKDFHFDAIAAFENYEIEKMRDGHVVVTTKVVGIVAQLLWKCAWRAISLPCVIKISGLVVISQGSMG